MAIKLKISEAKMIDTRDAFFDALYNIARDDTRVILLAADMTANSLVEFKDNLAGQYINVGVAEQNMVSIAAGLALADKKVFIYSIIPFVTLRCYEQIKIDLCAMNLAVTIIGVGPGFAYGSDGPTHHATSDIAVMRALPEITILNPSDPVMTEACAQLAYKSCGPVYIRIDKERLPVIYSPKRNDFSDGLIQLSRGSDLTIISTGIMVHRTLKIAEELNRLSISTGVVDLYRIKPLNEKKILEVLGEPRHIVTIEENSIIGGIGTVISEVLLDNRRAKIHLKRIAIADEHCFACGSREDLHKFYRLDVASVVKDILNWLKKKSR